MCTNLRKKTYAQDCWKQKNLGNFTSVQFGAENVPNLLDFIVGLPRNEIQKRRFWIRSGRFPIQHSVFGFRI